MGLDVGDVRYLALIQSLLVELLRELVGGQDTCFTFMRPWASVINLSLFYQQPDFVNSTLLLGIPQVHIDLAIPINTARL